MRAVLLTLLLILTTPLYAAEDLSHITDAGGMVYFSDDMEDGTVYRGSANAHSGGGYWDQLGGNSTGPIADNPCIFNADTHHATHISTDSAGESAVVGSLYAMKTPYDGDCPGESTTRDRSSILGVSLSEFYIRWYQKFTGNWMNGDAQHKMFKHENPDGHVGGLRFGSRQKYWRMLVPNNHLPNGELRWPGKDRSVWAYASDQDPDSTTKVVDDDPDTTRTDFETDRWYCFEMHFKGHTAGNADGIHEAWVDGELWFRLEGMVWGDPDDYTVATPESYAFELQHIYYDRDTNDDQPTYMDNMVVADMYIGPIDGTPLTYVERASGQFSGTIQ